MKMDPRSAAITYYTLSLFVVLLTLSSQYLTIINMVFNSTVAPFTVFIFPGLFYYYANKQRQAFSGQSSKKQPDQQQPDVRNHLSKNETATVTKTKRTGSIKKKRVGGHDSSESSISQDETSELDESQLVATRKFTRKEESTELKESTRMTTASMVGKPQKSFFHLSYKVKSKIGLIYGALGFVALLCLVSIQIYQLLIHKNPILFTYFHPKCAEPQPLYTPQTSEVQ